MINKSPNLIDSLSKLTDTLDLPIAITILPQLGSSPLIAVFTKGEFAIENPIFFASLSVLQLSTLIDINFDAPSPSATTLLDKFKRTLFNEASKSLIFSSLTLIIFECLIFH